MTARTRVHGLEVATDLHRFIEEKVLPGTGVDSARFWKGFDAIVSDLAPKNIALLAERDRLQSELDRWHKAHPGPIKEMAAYRGFLEKIGYLVPPPAGAKATTTDVDAELALQAGPQLVVPILNARYSLNAANARWGSLYDALYGTDVIAETGGAGKGKGYNPVRGGKVMVTLRGGAISGLEDNKQFVGYQGDAANPSSVLLKHHGLHIDVRIDRQHPIGATDPAGVCDLVIEAALSTILDLEDSIAAVDAEDKHLAYANWLGIVKGTLTDTFDKGGRKMTRGLNADRLYTTPGGKGEVRLHGRALLFLRNVGHLMTNPAILWG